MVLDEIDFIPKRPALGTTTTMSWEDKTGLLPGSLLNGDKHAIFRALSYGYNYYLLAKRKQPISLR